MIWVQRERVARRRRCGSHEAGVRKGKGSVRVGAEGRSPSASRPCAPAALPRTRYPPLTRTEKSVQPLWQEAHERAKQKLEETRHALCLCQENARANRE